MAKAYVFLADGFEDIEALAPIDIMRRGGVEVVTVGIMGTNEVISAHGVTVLADVPFEFAGDFEDADLLMLPGGMPGASNLNEHEGVKDAWERESSISHTEQRGIFLQMVCRRYSSPSIRKIWIRW